jgi:hypothetical protein
MMMMMMIRPLVVSNCCKCGSSDVGSKVYGKDPEYVVIACFDCREFFTLQVVRDVLGTIKEMIEQ